MLITISKPKGKFEENDLIAINKDNRFIGYITIESILSDINSVLVEADKKVVQTFNLVEGESIPYDFEICEVLSKVL